MFLSISAILAFAFTTNVANGQETLIPILKMPDVQTYTEIPCSQKCNMSMDIGLEILSMMFGNVLKEASFSMGSCDSCKIKGLDGFKFTHKCFMNPEENVYDHQFEFTFPHFNGICECDFSNSPNEAAEKLNAEAVIDGQCGDDDYKNTVVCKPIECKGSQGGKGQSSVKLALNFANLEASVVIRVDTRKYQTAFPTQLSLKMPDPLALKHEGPAEFDDTWKCITENAEAFICHLGANAPKALFSCLTPENDDSIVDKLLYVFGKC